MTKKFRAGMVGAGNICEFHVAAVKALPDVELIGVCDLDRKRAQENAEKWGTTAFDSMEQMIEAGANVIHVLTPPAAHAKVAKAALEKGCHVLVEKPIAEDEAEALEVGALARRKGLVASVNHSLLYDPQVKRALDQVKAGKLGEVVSVDILRGSEYPPYEGGNLPPWYRDAGYPFRDIGVHCLYIMQELLGPIEDVEAKWESLGGDPNLAFDEWRALVHCKRGLGQFQLTYNTKPMQSQIIIHGTKGVLRVDLFAMFHGKRASTPLPKAAERLVNAFADSIQPLIDVPVNVFKFVRKEVQAYQGLRDLVRDFYLRLESGEQPPVSVEDAAQVVHWVEKVARDADKEHVQALSKFTLSEKVPYLVTGASGSLGKAVVKKLREQGHRVRVFVRRMPAKPAEGIEYAFGNLGDPVAVDRAVKGAEIVIHCGAAMKGGWPEHKGGTVIGTQNVIDACRKHKVKQLVHISSMSVFDWAGMSGKGTVDESVELEPRADERGAYTRAKLEAERFVSEAATQGLPCVILRPGQIFGGGINLINGAVARNAGGRWLILGDGNLELPLVYIDDVVDSITASIEKKLTKGEVIQIIDPETLTQKDVLDLAGSGKPMLRVPRPVVFALGKLSEIPLGMIGKPSPIGVYRLKSALAKLHYESDRAEKLLGWKPRVGVREGIRRVSQGEAATSTSTPSTSRSSDEPSKPAEARPIGRSAAAAPAAPMIAKPKR
ncbi:MAG TPA: NAD-dependent epimerase/dehydratase family protein [Kofleriaceae bacterium]|nr:NAD-dependent epimerase/dehydratase family protein [Kofleriaceae bacterium]